MIIGILLLLVFFHFFLCFIGKKKEDTFVELMIKSLKFYPILFLHLLRDFFLHLLGISHPVKWYVIRCNFFFKAFFVFIILCPLVAGFSSLHYMMIVRNIDYEATHFFYTRLSWNDVVSLRSNMISNNPLLKYHAKRKWDKQKNMLIKWNGELSSLTKQTNTLWVAKIEMVPDICAPDVILFVNEDRLNSSIKPGNRVCFIGRIDDLIQDRPFVLDFGRISRLDLK